MFREIKSGVNEWRSSSSTAQFTGNTCDGATSSNIERFALSGSRLTLRRLIVLKDGTLATTTCRLRRSLRKRSYSQDELAALWDRELLRSAEWPKVVDHGPEVRLADLFSGCGLMSLGVWEACRAIGKRAVPVFAADVSTEASAIYRANFAPEWFTTQPLETLLNRRLGARPSAEERNFEKAVGPIDVVVGGPPCQGHSNLNNHTRGDDPKNRLYERMARFVELVRPTHVIVENVPQVLRDRTGSVSRTLRSLEAEGYYVDHDVIEMASLGVPQRRRRHVLVGSLKRKVNVGAMIGRYRRTERSVGWALDDLLYSRSTAVMDQPSATSEANIKRIDYLFDNELYDLPDSLRPDCHRLKPHRYKSVYGRMRWEEPAQTITSGFLNMGQGRFVHPKLRRTLTLHEGARLQMIPDFFSFDGLSTRTTMAEMIGNAVPPKATYVLALELLR